MRKLILTVCFLLLFISTATAAPIVNFGNSYDGRGGGSILMSSTEDYSTMIAHVVNTTDVEVIRGLLVHSVGYDLGYVTPKFGVMPHQLRAYFTFTVHGTDTEVSIKLWYRREMGNGYVGHTILVMKDRNLDGKPDLIVRRYLRTMGGRVYLGKDGWKTPLVDKRLPNDIQEWNYWFDFFAKVFKQEGADLK